MHLTLRTLLAYLDDTLEPAQTQDIGRQIADAPPQIQELIRRVKKVTRQRRLLAPDAEGAGTQAVDPNNIAAYLDNSLPAEDMVALETLCLQSDVHLAEVAACHQIMTVWQSEPMRVPPTAHQTMYGLARGREAIPTREPPRPRHVAAEADGAAAAEPQFLGLPWLRIPGAPARRLVPVAAVLMILMAGVVLLLAVLNLSTQRNRPGNGPVAIATPTVQAATPSVAAGESPRPRASAPEERPRAVVATEPPKPALETIPTAWMEDGAAQAAGRDPRQAVCRSVLLRTGWVAGRPGMPSNLMLTLLEKAVTTSELLPARPADVVKPPVELKPPKPNQPPPNPAKIALAQYAPAVVKDSLLMRRAAEGDWKVAKPLMRLQTGELLVTAAGYRSDIVLDSGMKLQMAGALPNPNPAAQAPILILESALTLHQNPDFDLELTLERGRIIITNKRPEPGTVRLRFLDQLWDLRLVQANSEVGVEIYGRIPLGPGPWNPIAHLTLMTAGGEVELKRGPNPEMLQANQRIEWSNAPGAVVSLPPQAIAEVPAWFRPPHRLTYPDTIMAVTLGFQRRLTEKPAETKWLVEACREALEEKPLERYLALATLEAVDQLGLILTTLESEGTPELHRMAQEALWHWIGHQPNQQVALREILIKNEYTADEADILVQLLRGYEPPKPTPPKDTVEKLLRLLNHPRQSIRELALFDLRAFATLENLRGYDPTAPAEVRVRAIDAIRMRLKL